MKIFYKILNALCALTVIPVLIFLPMFRFIMTIGMASGGSGLGGILGGILGNAIDVEEIISKATGIDFKNLPEFYTLKEGYEMFNGENAMLDSSGVDVAALPDGLISSFRNMFIVLAVILVILLAILIIGIFTKKKWINILLGGCGIGATFLMNKCFLGAAGPLVSGKMSVTSILEAVKALEEYKSYLSYIDIDIRIFELSTVYTALFLIFGALILINAVFFFVDQYTAD